MRAGDENYHHRRNFQLTNYKYIYTYIRCVFPSLPLFIENGIVFGYEARTGLLIKNDTSSFTVVQLFRSPLLFPSFT